MSKQNESLEAKVGEFSVVEKTQTANPFSSEELLGFMLESAKDYSIFTTDADGRVTSWNAGAERFFGYSEAEILGQSAAILFTPEDREIGVLEQELSTAITEGRADDERWHLRKDGTRFWMSGMVRRHRNDEGRLQGFIKIGRDLTEQKHAEDTLHRRERELSDFVENATVGLYWVGGDGIIKWANKTELDLLGYTPEEYIGHHIAEFHADQEMIDNILQRLTDDEALHDHEARMRCKDGTFKNVLINSNVFRENGKFIHTRCFTRDITERKQAQEELQKAHEELETRVKKRTSELAATNQLLQDEITERRQAAQALVESEERFQFIARATNDVLYDWQIETSAVWWNEAIQTNFGYVVDEVGNNIDWWLEKIHPDDAERIGNSVSQFFESDEEFWTEEYRFACADGSYADVVDRGIIVRDEQGKPLRMIGSMIDITERKQAEQSLIENEERRQQSQKMEAIGTLTGGVAHDFNNMLTAINGYSELTLRRMKEDDPLRHNIEEIKKAGDRSAKLTYQLLAFSRQQVLNPILINLNEVIDETSNMLQRLLGEDIQFVSIINPKLGFVMADFGQLSQIILNLTVNAMDAMPQGGKLTIETANVFLDSTYASRHSGIIPGAYVMLAVSDTGTGMDAETQKHIFEPFFTTKEVGQGTGLGLATVYGIVKQSGSNINVYSEEGVGTTFKIYLPRVAGQADVVDIENNDKELSTAAGTILLVEDEDIVRALAKQVLEECGYTVVEARNGVEALAMCDTGDCKFDLLMTDVVMPQMGGRELANKLKEKLPDLQVLFTSGYTDDAVVRHGVIEVGTNFIQKPFTPDSLTKKVRELLGAA